MPIMDGRGSARSGVTKDQYELSAVEGGVRHFG